MEIEQPIKQESIIKQNISFEYQQKIRYEKITNDNLQSNTLKLIKLKSLFSNQLPRMPKQYILRILFDDKHSNLIMLEQNNGEKKSDFTIAASACYRIFQEENLAQLVFFAVHSSKQLKGYGSKLLARFKNQMQLYKIKYILTYADNSAIGFFKKNGFSSKITIPPKQQSVCLKQYSQATKMQYIIDPDIQYLNLTKILLKQKKLLEEKIKDHCLSKSVYQPLSGPQIHQPEKLNKLKLNPEDLSGIVNSGWTWNQYVQLRRSRPIDRSLQKILQNLMNHPASGPFKRTISRNCIQYYKIIQHPINLWTVQKRLFNKEYIQKDKFIADIQQIFTNCQKVYPSTAEPYKFSVVLQAFFSQQIIQLNKMEALNLI